MDKEDVFLGELDEDEEDVGAAGERDGPAAVQRNGPRETVSRHVEERLERQRIQDDYVIIYISLMASSIGHSWEVPGNSRFISSAILGEHFKRDQASVNLCP